MREFISTLRIPFVIVSVLWKMTWGLVSAAHICGNKSTQSIDRTCWKAMNLFTSAVQVLFWTFFCFSRIFTRALTYIILFNSHSRIFGSCSLEISKLLITLLRNWCTFYLLPWRFVCLVRVNTSQSDHFLYHNCPTSVSGTIV